MILVWRGVGQRVRPGEPRLADRVGIGVLTAAFPPELVDAAVDTWHAREEWHRVLPARVVAYFALAMVLFFDCGYAEVWNRLLSGLAWARTFRLRHQVGMQPSTAAITKARARLGWEPLAEMLGQTMVPGHADAAVAPWGWWRGLRMLAVEGFTMSVAPTPGNIAEFGVPTGGKGPGGWRRCGWWRWLRLVAAACKGCGSGR
jgi:hypothetical protein